MRALSWKQPYASLMLHGKIETRTWYTRYRGPVLICTSLKSYNIGHIDDITGRDRIPEIIKILEDDPTFGLCGHAIAIGNLVDCRRMLPADEKQAFAKYYPDLFCHVYENVMRIHPIPFKGRQGWGKVTPDIIARIQYL